ncbi:sugar ABC transporter substrate-binding protein [Paenibacillus rhizovicinus]|uniref:Sugar ABC transporter substrate-binding protein n=1 Tax=Paenibacillus rhizovicinus TaxID=2704463 RepID=A0A6C0P5B0_9BACL|nr:sugar ABC transporter substrate-binding protein [Paenibacillus rhizovicinus]QHW33698.1 sugar ABC transporter substrate-binding protein [Paenibacillus rhizovicinus]
MKRNRTALLVLVILFAIGAAACSSGGGNNGEGSSGGSNGKKVDVVWWFPAKEQEAAMKQIADNFNKKQDKINLKVQLNAGADYYTKLQTTLAAKNGPDIMWMNGPNFPKFQSKGFLLKYDELIERDGFSMADFPDALVKLYSKDGVYGMPKDYDTIGLFYNKELFDKAGVPYPTEKWTWEDLRNAAKKLTIGSGDKTTQWGIAVPASTQEVIYPFFVQNGVKPMSDDRTSLQYDSPEGIEAIQFLYDLMYKDKSSPDGQYMTDNDPTQLFQSGKVAMIMNGSWMAKPYYDVLKDKVDVQFMPIEKTKGNIIHGVAWVANANTKHKDETWEVIKYLGSKEVAMLQADSGTVIPALKGTQDAWVKALPMNLKIFTESAEFATPYPTAFDPEWETTVATHLTNIWLNKESPADGMKKVTEEANALLSAAK